MKKVLITGASGFAGGFLAEHLTSKDEFEIYGTYHSDSSRDRSPVKDKIQFQKVELQNAKQVNSLIATVQPDQIYHLAAASPVGESFSDPVQTMHTNIDSQINLLEAVKKLNKEGIRVMIISSAQVYGYVRQSDLPVDEETALRPASPYAISKIAQDYMGFQYAICNKLYIIRARPFNHIG